MRALECFLLTPSSVSLGSLDILVLAVSQSLEFLGVLTRAIIPHPWILPGAHKRSLQVIHSPLELLSQDHPPPQAKELRHVSTRHPGSYDSCYGHSPRAHQY